MSSVNVIPDIYKVDSYVNVNDYSSNDYQYKEIHEKSTANVSSLKKLEFEMTEQADWTHLSNSYLSATFKITTTNGGAAVNTANVAFQNGLSMFSEARLMIDGHLKEHLLHLPQVVQMKNLVEFSNNFNASVAQNFNHYPDTASGVDKKELNTTDTAGTLTAVSINANYNKGHHQRQQNAQGAKEQTLIFPLKYIFQWFKTWDKLTKGMRVKVELYKNSNEEALIGDGTGYDATSFSIEKMTWWIPIVKPNPTLEASLNSKLNSGKQVQVNNIRYEMIRSDSRTLSNARYKVGVFSNKPVGMYVALQTASRLDSATGNSLIFDRHDLEKLYVKLNNVQYPSEQYELEWNDTTGGKLNIVRAYFDYLRSNSKHIDGADGLGFGIRDYVGLYPIYYLDLSKSNIETNSVYDCEIQYNLGSGYGGGAFHIWSLMMFEDTTTLQFTDGMTKCLY